MVLTEELIYVFLSDLLAVDRIGLNASPVLAQKTNVLHNERVG